MKTKIIENPELIATRRAPGDNWVLVGDPKKEVYNSLTNALEAYFHQTGFKGAYRLDPMDSKLYAIRTHEEEIIKEEPKEYGIYGELNWKQGI